MTENPLCKAKAMKCMVGEVKDDLDDLDDLERVLQKP